MLTAATALPRLRLVLELKEHVDKAAEEAAVRECVEMVKEMGLLFNDPTLYNNLNATTENAASLLEDLKEHPKRYVHFSLFGKKDK